ncbi:MAG: DUF1570 domain-containing protein [Phycisphaeraceae bacterium]|nr:DUF1570 domain-containing protein [Phycisphaeraceae bacterium]
MRLRWCQVSPLIVPALGASVVGVAVWTREPGPVSGAEGAPQAARPAAVYAPSTRFPVALRTERFLLLSDADPSWVREQAEWLEQVASVFEREMTTLGFTTQRPASPLRVMLFASRDDFIRFAREIDAVDARWMGGYYEPARNRVVAYDDRSSDSFLRAAAHHASHAREHARRATRAKLAHEAAHLLAFNTGVQSRAVAYPEWFTEGLAERVARAAMGHTTPDAPTTLSCAGPHLAATSAHQNPDGLASSLRTLAAWAIAAGRAVESDDHHARYALWSAAFDALADSRPGAIAELAATLRLADDPAPRVATAPLD